MEIHQGLAMMARKINQMNIKADSRRKIVKPNGAIDQLASNN